MQKNIIIIRLLLFLIIEIKLNIIFIIIIINYFAKNLSYIYIKIIKINFKYFKKIKNYIIIYK